LGCDGGGLGASSGQYITLNRDVVDNVHAGDREPIAGDEIFPIQNEIEEPATGSA